MISGVFCTARTNPRFDYLCDSLAVNLARCPHPFELIVVDKLLWNPTITDRRDQLNDAVRGRFSYRHVPPKPNAWQGPYRKTSRDYSDHNGSRNSGIALARGAYVVFIDDETVLDEFWYTHHYRGAVQGVAVAGAYRSYNTAVVENGRVISGELCPGQDHRLEISGPIPKQCSGGWFFGLNCGAPLKYLLAVNGFDEQFAGQAGSDDLCLGLRIERVGCKIYYTPDCMINQIMENHEAICNNPGSGYPKGPEKQKELTLRSGRVAFCNEMLIQNLLDEPKRIWTVGNDFNLQELRARVLSEGVGAFPKERAVTHHWADGQPLLEM